MDYYSEKLSGRKLQQCYDTAPKRIKLYLESEINFVLEKIKPSDDILELGCGYGRVLRALAPKAKTITGIDISEASIEYGKQFTVNIPNCRILKMDAANLSFKNNSFDAVVCIQNGISAFHTDQKKLISESVRVTKGGGIVLFSTYSENFWDDRLEWFRQQSNAGLVGEIDFEKTGNGIIICKDGFSAGTVSPDMIRELTSDIEAEIKITEVDKSSIFCEIRVL